MSGFVCGIDLGGTSVKIGVLDTEGNMLKKWSIPTVISNDGMQVFSDIADSVKENLGQMNISLADVEGIGIGVPGAVLGDDVINRCINLNLGVVSIKEVLSDKLEGKKVYALNDANAAALGEMWMGSGRSYSNLVFVTLGTGIGGGIIIDKKIVPGCFGAGGEIGHIRVTDKKDRLCNCGRYGCFEQYCSATGLVKTYKEYSETNDSDITAKEIFERYGKGEKYALETMELFAEMAGKAFATVSAVVDPEVIIIGGGVAAAGDVLIDIVSSKYKDYVFHASKETEFKCARLLNDAGIYGAAYRALHK